MAAKQSEAAFQSQVIDLAHACRWRVAAFRKVRVQRANGSVYYETPVQADGKGWLDIALCRGPRMLFRELKVGRNKVTPEQMEWVACLIAAGQDVGVWHPNDWDRIVEELR